MSEYTNLIAAGVLVVGGLATLKAIGIVDRYYKSNLKKLPALSSEECDTDAVASRESRFGYTDADGD